MKNRGTMQAVLGMLVLVLLFVFVSLLFGGSKDQQYGATFSTHYAEELGIDWRDAYNAMLEDLDVNAVRIPIHWWRIQGNASDFDWSEIDYMMDRAEIAGADVTLVIGQKVVRWPECFVPEWAESLQDEDFETALFDFVEAGVNRYKDHPVLVRWQVDNEAYFPFGECPKSVAALTGSLRDQVRNHPGNEKPIQLTTSGEQSIWAFKAMPADILGVSLYRTVKSDAGTITFPHSPFWYRVQALLSRPFVDAVIISELQAEPWGVHEFDRQSTTFAEDGYAAFTAEDLSAHRAFAAATRMDEVYIWGVEWWYALKIAGEDRLWEYGKSMIHSANQSVE